MQKNSWWRFLKKKQIKLFLTLSSKQFLTVKEPSFEHVHMYMCRLHYDGHRDGVLSRADLVAIFDNIGGKFSREFSTSFYNFWEKINPGFFSVTTLGFHNDRPGSWWSHRWGWLSRHLPTNWWVTTSRSRSWVKVTMMMTLCVVTQYDLNHRRVVVGIFFWFQGGDNM